MDFSANPDSDASGYGQRFEIDLTRHDLRSGTLFLPGSMLEVFEAGPVALRDPAREREYTLTFAPPRRLHGLGAFLEAHGLQPNDTLIFVLGADGLELHTRKRPPKKRPKPEEPAAAETAVPSQTHVAESVQPQPEVSPSGWVVREVRRGGHAGPPPSRQEQQSVYPRGGPNESDVRSEVAPRGRSSAPGQDPSAPTQPRSPQGEQPQPRSTRGESRRHDAGGAAAGQGGDPAEAVGRPRRSDAAEGKPRAADTGGGKPGSGETRVERRPDPKRELRTPPPTADEALDLVRAHLMSPDTPAIVRLEDVAYTLRIHEEAAWHALERLARDPESGVSLIRRDFYRVSRQAQPKFR